MEWLRKYKFKNSNNFGWVRGVGWFKKMNYLLDKNLNNFEYLNEINEEEFLRGEILKLNNNYVNNYWSIISSMVEKDVKQIRKEKLNGMVKKI